MGHLKENPDLMFYQINSLKAENERLRDVLLNASNSMSEFVGSFYQRQDVMEPLKKIEAAAREATEALNAPTRKDEL